MKKHGNTGNQNAAKDVTKSTHLHIRVTEKIKDKASRDAARRNMSVSQWVAHLIEKG